LSSLSGLPASEPAPIADPTAPRSHASSGLIAATPLLALLAALVSLVFVNQILAQVWQTGRFYDTDDAMRLVQVRDFLAGQGWYDLVAHRLNPPDGMLSHWSRIVDTPLAGLVLLFSLFTAREQAEILARLVFPFLMHIAYYAALFALIRRLTNDVGVIAGLFLAIFMAITNIQFMPGRIDHHGPQIFLLVLMALTVVRMILDSDRRAAWMLGGAIALSFAISIENMPFIAALLAVLAIAWACRLQTLPSTLRPLGLSLLVCVPLAFVIIVPPSRYLDPVADAFSLGHVVLLMLAGIACCAAATVRIETTHRRWLSLVAFGVACLALTALAFPYLLHDPLAAVDPLVRRFWLSRVREALPLLVIVSKTPLDSVQYIGPFTCGVIAVLTAVILHSGAQRWAWITIAVLVILGTLGTFWQVRVSTSTLPFIVVAGAWAVSALCAHLARNNSRFVALKGAALAILFSVITWNMATEPLRSAEPTSDGAGSCFDTAAYRPLRDLPRQLTLATIDQGPYVLAFSPHPVVAAAYHRNNRGNHLLIEAMTSDPETARKLIETAGAKLLVYCPTGPEFKGYAKEAPQGLAAALRDGLPSWLTPVGDQSGAIKILAVR